MRSDSAAFDLKNTELAKEPRYVIEIAFNSENTDLYYFTSHSNAALPDAVLYIGGIIKNISGTNQSISPETALSTIGDINFDIVDFDDTVTSLQYDKLQLGKGLRGKRVRVYVGYDGLDFDDYTLVQTQIVEDVSYADGAYHFQCDDIQRQVRKDIFDLFETTLTSTISASATTIPVTSTSGFEPVAHGDAYSDAPNQTVYYFKIEDEVIRATGKTAVSFTGCTRGRLNTKAASHTVDATTSIERRTKVEEYVYLELPAVKLIYALLTGDLIGQGATLPDTWHLIIDTSFVRLTDFTEYGEDAYDLTSDAAGFPIRFEGLTKQDGKKFIEKELLILLGAFSPIYSSGEIGLRRMASVLSSSSFVYQLDADNVVSHSDLTYDMSAIHNHIEIEWNWLDTRGKYSRRNVLLDSDSIAVNGLSTPLRFKFRGLYGSRHSTETLGERFNSFRDRYSGPPMRLSVQCLMSANILEIGDVVRVKLDTLKDYYTDDTLDRSFEVQNVSINWIDGTVNLRLFASSQAAGAVSATAASTVIEDSWYTSEGTDLATHLGAAYEEIGGVGHIKSNASLTGGDDLKTSVFYHDGDLQIDDAVVLSITKNVQLRVKGFFTPNGGVDGIGTGHAGAADLKSLNQFNPYTLGGAHSSDLYSTSHNNGIVGFIGPTVSGGGEYYNNRIDASHYIALAGNRVDGLYTGAPNLTLNYSNGVLGGIPTNLQGTSGSSGGNNTFKGGAWIYDGWATWMGGAGGAGGAGLMVVCRGASFGASGYINLSGSDGDVGTYHPTTTYGPYFGPGGSSSSSTNYANNAGGGAGGAPGAAYFVIDGAEQTLPDLLPIQSKFGCTRTGGSNKVPSPAQWHQAMPTNWYPYYTGIGCDNSDLSGYLGGSRVVFAIGADVPEEDTDASIINPPTGLTLSSGTDDVLLNQDGTITVRVKASWTSPDDPRVTGNEVQYKKSTDSVWINSVDVIDEIETFIGPVESGIDYDIRVRSGDNIGETSDWVTISNYAVLGKLAPPQDVPSFESYQNGTSIVLKWSKVSDFDLSGYEIRYLESTGSGLWADASALTEVTKGTNITTVDIPDGTWEFMIKAVDTSGNYSVNHRSKTVTFSSNFDVIDSESFAPDLFGTLTNMVRHHTSKLVPQSQNLASEDGWETFDQTVPNPYSDCYYEVAEYDNSFDDDSRISAIINSYLAPTEIAGRADPHLEIDYRLDAGAYDGFEEWSVGSAVFRYLKVRSHIETALGISIITDFTRTVDAIEYSQKAEDVEIAITGTTITFPQSFHVKPFVEILILGSTATMYSIDAKSKTQFTIYLFDATGTGIAGVIDWKATGV